jgi:hypothetical protein
MLLIVFYTGKIVCQYFSQTKKEKELSNEVCDPGWLRPNPPFVN